MYHLGLYRLNHFDKTFSLIFCPSLHSGFMITKTFSTDLFGILFLQNHHERDKLSVARKKLQYIILQRHTVAPVRVSLRDFCLYNSFFFLKLLT